MARRSGVFVCAMIGLMSVQAAIALQEEKRSTAAGAYTAEQSSRGEKTFISACGGCHTPDQFVGEFLQAWSGKSANELLEMIRGKMPQDDPGSLPRQQYADILAYMFEKNGLPAGKDELPGAQAELEKVVVELPKP